MTARKTTLWPCPKCGRTFVTKNMSHSCGRMSAAASAHSGPVTVDPEGRGIVFPRVRKIDDYGTLGPVLHFRLERQEDLDPALARLRAEAYAVAAQREITPSRVRRATVGKDDS